MKKFLLYINVLIVIVLGVLVAWELWQNNKPVEYPGKTELDTRLEAVAGWLDRNDDALIQIENPILFWMIRQAWENTGHPTLRNFYFRYKLEKLSDSVKNLWTPFFEDDYRPRVPPVSRLDGYRDYQLFFVYGLSCDSFMEDEPRIQAQMDPGFCKNHFLHPRCVTHQVMGLRLMQRSGCGHEDRVEATLATLQDMMVNEMRWDFRVGDAYIQRVCMLTDSGAGDRVKPVWIRRILDAQNDDGSWDDFYPVTSLPDGKMLGFTSRLPEIRQEITGNFHTTAQAVWLLSMLIRNHTYIAPHEVAEHAE